MKKVWLRRILFPAIIALILAVVCFMALSLRRPVASLANGTQLSLVAVTYGSNNVFSPGDLVDKIIYRFAPTKGINWGPIKIVPMAPMTDNWRKADGSPAFPNRAVLWLGHRGPTNSPPLPVPEQKWFSDVRSTLADETGEEWEMRSGTSHFRSSTIHGLNGVSSWGFSSYPRRGKTLRYRVYAFNGSNAWDTLADFTLPNPTRGPYPVWIPSTLPLTRTNGDLKVSLVGLMSGAKDIKYFSGGKRPFTRVTFEVKENDKQSRDWLPDRMEATDATGNEPWPSAAGGSMTNDLVRYEIMGTSLSPSEVWRLRMRFVKERDPDRKRMWSSPDLLVTDGLLSPMNLKTNFQTSRITLECSQTSFRNTIRLNIDPLPKDSKFYLAGIVDNLGRKVEYVSGSFDDPGFNAQWKIPDGAEWIRITIGLAETRFVEFVAKPTRE